MLRNWRSWVLLVLFAGPFVAYFVLGFFWLAERGWALYAFAAWVASGALAYYLGDRWTKSRRQVLPPIDWDAPRTFGPHDRKAWELVQDEAEKGDAVSMDQLAGMDVYIDTGRRLAERLAIHYHPLSTNPVEHVPVVEILTALELAADDLVELCREIPGGDLVTYSHWRRAVQASGYISKANEIYGYLLPIFQPMSGLVRLGTQKLMVQPAWRNMQQNVMRWFFRAYVNRLGTHLIELYSGRLAIGAEAYRRLTHRGGRAGGAIAGSLVIVVAGARQSGKSSLIGALRRECSGDLGPVRNKLEAGGFEPDLADLLKTAEWAEAPGYTVNPGGESARDRATRKDAVEDAVEADLLILVIDGSRADVSADAKFLDAWARWYDDKPSLDPPPALVVVTGADRVASAGQRKAIVDAVRAALPKPVAAEVVAVGLGGGSPTGVADRLLPAVALLLHRAEHTAVLRHFYRISTKSKARRLITQVGRQGRRLWFGLKDAQKARSHAGDGAAPG